MMFGNTDEFTSNQFLAALPGELLAQWQRQLERVDLPLGLVLYEPETPLSHAYFPCTAIVSLLYFTEKGDSAEIAVVGNEGMLGVALLMGGNTRPNRAVVQSAGYGYRLKAEVIKVEFERCVLFMHLFLRYTQALITQTAQTAVCNRHHSIDQQLCRWLLMSMDRLQGDELIMTQERIANALGVRREGVTEAARSLLHADLISYTRGHIKILDRPGLERRTCECYAVVKEEYARLLPKCSVASGALTPVSEVQKSCLHCRDDMKLGREIPKCMSEMVIKSPKVRRVGFDTPSEPSLTGAC
jgi:CRP-like cAMP-binding protein